MFSISSIREWAIALIAASVISGALCLLCPEGSMQRYVKYAASMLTLFLVLAPLASLIREIPALISDGSAALSGAYDAYSPGNIADGYSEWVLTHGAENLRAGIIGAVAAETGVT